MHSEVAQPTKPDVESGIAGASSRREHARRQRKREDDARRRFGRVGVLLTKLTNEPQSVSAWERGAEGEEVVAKRLENALAGTGAKLLHDRRRPGRGKANIDHIVIGPGGVTVIDTKNYRGKVRLETVGGLFSERRTILIIGGHDRTKLVEGVEAQVEVVRDHLARADRVVDVAGAICFADVDGLPLFSRPQLRGVTIGGSGRVAKLANRPGTLGPDVIDELWRRIDRDFPRA